MRGELSRRSFLQAGGAPGLLGLLPPARVDAFRAAAPKAGQAGRFLNAHELDTLRAVVARLVPGPPEDPDPGALEAGAADAIDLLLGAFAVDPPMIHAGGPYSGRHGGGHHGFSDFVGVRRPPGGRWRGPPHGARRGEKTEVAGPVPGRPQLHHHGVAALHAGT